MSMMDRTAVISECGRYRYALSRRWDWELPALGWIMLNPSTADAMQDDPTIRKCIGFARRWGYGGIEVRNLFALRATNPDELRKQGFVTGRENDEFTAQLHQQKIKVIAAWGRPRWQGVILRSLFVSGKLTPELHCIGETKDGYPKHPLYQSYTAAPLPFWNMF